MHIYEILDSRLCILHVKCLNLPRTVSPSLRLSYLKFPKVPADFQNSLDPVKFKSMMPHKLVVCGAQNWFNYNMGHHRIHDDYNMGFHRRKEGR